jgi:hypothetical protein
MVYLAIKYHADNKNKDLIRSISHACQINGLHCFCIAQDIEMWGEKSFEPADLMRISFEYIRSSDFVLIEFSEKGVGIGIEAGYAFALNLPIYVIHLPEVEVSETLKGIATAIFPYDSLDALPSVLAQTKIHFSHSNQSSLIGDNTSDGKYTTLRDVGRQTSAG